MKLQHIIYAGKPKVGGWVTYTAHLSQALHALGVKNCVHRLTKTGNGTPQPMGAHGTVANVMSHQDLGSLKGAGVLFSAIDNKHFGVASYFSDDPTAVWVLHDPGELKHKDMKAAAQNWKGKIVVIREKQKYKIEELIQRETELVKHPYVRTHPKGDGRYRAVASSRVDWDKKTELIIQANDLVDEDRTCRIYGAANRLYVNLGIESKFPHWKKYYFGEHFFGDALCAQAQMMIDMTHIADDGYGTQYTFLEAWDAGVPVVVNAKWGEMPGAITAGTPADLADILNGERDSELAVAASEGVDRLSFHTPEYLKNTLSKMSPSLGQ